MHDTGHKGAPAVPEHVSIQGRARVEMQRVTSTHTTQELFPCVIKAKLASVFFRHHNLAASDTVVDCRQVRLIKVSTIVHTTQVALVVGRRHSARNLWVVQVCIEHDNAVGQDVDSVLAPDPRGLGRKVLARERLGDARNLLRLPRQPEGLTERAHSLGHVAFAKVEHVHILGQDIHILCTRNVVTQQTLVHQRRVF